MCFWNVFPSVSPEGLEGRKATVLSQTRAPTAGLEGPLAGVTNRGFTLHYRNGISSKAKG